MWWLLFILPFAHACSDIDNDDICDDIDAYVVDYDGDGVPEQRCKDADNDGACDVTTACVYSTEDPSAHNPFDGTNVGGYSAPAFVDVDNDGDMDLVIGRYVPGDLKHYYENTGSASNPSYTRREGALNPFDGVAVGWDSAPAFVDADNDGDMDLVIGRGEGDLFYYENTGNATHANYTRREGALNPFDGVNVGYYSKPAFVDADNDGDMDLVIGRHEGDFKHYYENTGSPSNPSYTRREGALNPFDGVANVGFNSVPAFVDVDDDGDMDLVIGRYKPGDLIYYENTGSASNPSYTRREGALNPFDGVADVGKNIVPAFVDVDNDGYMDLVIGRFDGDLKFYHSYDCNICHEWLGLPIFNNGICELPKRSEHIWKDGEWERCGVRFTHVEDNICKTCPMETPKFDGTCVACSTGTFYEPTTKTCRDSVHKGKIRNFLDGIPTNWDKFTYNGVSNSYTAPSYDTMDIYECADLCSNQKELGRPYESFFISHSDEKCFCMLNSIEEHGYCKDTDVISSGIKQCTNTESLSTIRGISYDIGVHCYKVTGSYCPTNCQKSTDGCFCESDELNVCVKKPCEHSEFGVLEFGTHDFECPSGQLGKISVTCDEGELTEVSSCRDKPLECHSPQSDKYCSILQDNYKGSCGCS